MTGECLNTFLDELGISSTEGSTDRDALQALCRRDATLITHEQSKARHAAQIAQKAQATAEAAARKQAQVLAAVEQRNADKELIIPLLNACRHDLQNHTHDTAGATWVKETLERMKALYRLYFPTDHKPRKQPIKKEEWVALLSPHIQQVIASADAMEAEVHLGGLVVPATG